MTDLPPLPEPAGVIVVGTQALRAFTADQLREYAKKAVEAEIGTIINLLIIQHEAAAGRHNYWHVAANLIKAERR